MFMLHLSDLLLIAIVFYLLLPLEVLILPHLLHHLLLVVGIKILNFSFEFVLHMFQIFGELLLELPLLLQEGLEILSTLLGCGDQFLLQLFD